METTPPPHQLEFFLKLLVNYILRAHISYDKAFKDIIKRYKFPRWALRTFYKVGYHTINNYYGLRWLAAKAGYGLQPSGVINYFSRLGFSIRRAKILLRDETKRLSTSKRLSIMYSYPEYVVTDLLRHLNKHDVEKILSSLNTRKRWLRINTLRSSREMALKCLDETGVVFQEVDFPKYMLFVEHPKWDPIGRNRCVKNGYVVPQDISSSYVVEVLGIEKGRTLLDSCSAPGLKFSLVYMLTSNDIIGVGIDISSRRLLSMQKLLNLLGVSNARYVLVNADAGIVSFKTKFDNAIVDAPCSGLGAVFADPAVKLNAGKKNKLLSYHEKQYKILSNTLRYSRYVVYATCSIHPLEGELVVERVVSDGLAEPQKISLPNLGPAYKGFTVSSKTYRTIPYQIRGQGFYIAALRSRVFNN